MVPQLIYLALAAFGVGVALKTDKQPQEPHSFWHTVLVSSIILGLLYWGGFFDCFFS